MALERPRFTIKATVQQDPLGEDKMPKEAFYFVLQSKNGEVVATSEMYPSRKEAKEGAKRVRLLAATASISH